MDKGADGDTHDPMATLRKSAKPISARATADGAAEVDAYAQAQPPEFRAICNQLRALIDANIPKATSKLWHGGPVWFLGANPVVGYSATKKGVNLLFWNGQAFDEPDLKPVGKYSAAQAVFANGDDIDPKVICGWLNKAKTNVFDSVGFFKKQREAAKRK